MNLSQAKIDLAVLYKLHQLAEFDAGSLTPEDIRRHFMCRMPLRRLEVSLEELESKGDVDREYHPFHMEEGLWQITRQGMARVDRALKVPTSFIGRLHLKGDPWLESDEAQSAVLKSLSPTGSAESLPTTIKLPENLPHLPHLKVVPEDDNSINWGKWGAIAGIIAIPIAILLWYFG